MESISSKNVSGLDRPLAPLAPVARSAAVAATTADRGVVEQQLQLSAIAFGYDEKAPVDLERVSRIRNAVRSGTFPIYPARIADRLLALKLEWNPHGAK